MIENLEVVQSFLGYLLDDRHFSPYTARCYGVDLRQYAEFLAESRNITFNQERELAAFNDRKTKPVQRDQANVPDAGGGGTITSGMLAADVASIREFLNSAAAYIDKRVTEAVSTSGVKKTALRSLAGFMRSVARLASS